MSKKIKIKIKSRHKGNSYYDRIITDVEGELITIHGFDFCLVYTNENYGSKELIAIELSTGYVAGAELCKYRGYKKKLIKSLEDRTPKEILLSIKGVLKHYDNKPLNII